METQYQPSDLDHLSQSELIAIIFRQQALIGHLEERVRQLEAQIHKDSHNSSIPSSQSRPLPIKNLRQKTGKLQGGQPGHGGHTLKMVDQPARIIRSTVSRCEKCGQDLSALPALEYQRRQVFDIPAIICEVTEYQAEKKRCPCGHVTVASFPETVKAPVQYGLHLQTLVSLLANLEFLSCERISELLEQLLGYRVNESTVCSLQKKLSSKLADFEARSKLHLSQSEILHNDETGIPIAGHLAWLHVSSTEELTHYGIDVKRGKEGMDRVGILPDFQGVSIHDGWQAYFYYGKCRHGLCNAHHLRELTFFEEEEQAQWAGWLKKLLLFTKVSVEKAKEAGQSQLDPQTLRGIAYLYDRILRKASLQWPGPQEANGKSRKSKQQRCSERLWYYKPYVLAFAYDFGIPFDNNLAERDIRMMKLKEKVSGTFRSLQGAQCFARIRGYLSTVRKNGHNVFEEVHQALAGHPFLLPQWQSMINC
jgi:transposase